MGSALERFFAHIQQHSSSDEPSSSAGWDELLVLAYEEDTDIRLALPLSASDRETLRLWLQRINRGHCSETAFYGRRSVLTKSFFLTIAGKANFLCQTMCLRCPTDGVSPLGETIPIAVPPISSQSSDAEKRALYRARVVSALQGPFPATRPSKFGNRNLCVAVATILGRGVRKKDADNLVKALLDDMQGIIYDNDSAIQHLQSHRFQYEGELSYHLVHVNGVGGDLNSDVLDLRQVPSFLSGVPGF